MPDETSRQPEASSACLQASKDLVWAVKERKTMYAETENMCQHEDEGTELNLVRSWGSKHQQKM